MPLNDFQQLMQSKHHSVNKGSLSENSQSQVGSFAYAIPVIPQKKPTTAVSSPSNPLIAKIKQGIPETAMAQTIQQAISQLALEEKENMVSQAAELLPENSLGFEASTLLPKLFNALGAIPKQDRKEVIPLVLPLIQAKKISVVSIPSVLQAVAHLPKKERATLVNQTLSLLSGNKESKLIPDILNTLSSIPKEERNEVVSATKLLTDREQNASIIPSTLQTVYCLSPTRRANIIKWALYLTTAQTLTAEELETLITTISQIPEGKLEDIAWLVTSFLQGKNNEAAISPILEELLHMPQGELNADFSKALSLFGSLQFTSDLSKLQLIEAFRTIKEISREKKADILSTIHSNFSQLSIKNFFQYIEVLACFPTEQQVQALSYLKDIEKIGKVKTTQDIIRFISTSILFTQQASSPDLPKKYATKWYQYAQRRKMEREHPSAYQNLRHGKFWRQFPITSEQGLSSLGDFMTLSSDNVGDIEGAVKRLAPKIFETEFGSQIDETTIDRFIKKFSALDFILIHWTKRDEKYNSIKSLTKLRGLSQNELISAAQLEVEKNKDNEFDAGLENTNYADILELSNNSFAFFKMQLNPKTYPHLRLHRSRFGNHAYVFPMLDTQLMKLGHIYGTDPLAPTQNEVDANFFKQTIIGKALPKGKLKEYVGENHEKEPLFSYHFAEEIAFRPGQDIFYGKDILKGLAIYTLFESLKLHPMISKTLLESPSLEDPEIVKIIDIMLSRVLRIQALLPGEVGTRFIPYAKDVGRD